MAAPVIIVVALLALASACGPKFDDPYYDDVVRVVNNGSWSALMASRLLEIEADRYVRNEQLGDGYACLQIDSSIESLQKRYRDLRRDLEPLDPPDSASSWHGDFLRVIDESIDSLYDTRGALARGDQFMLDAALSRLEGLAEDGAELVDRFNDDFDRG